MYDENGTTRSLSWLLSNNDSSAAPNVRDRVGRQWLAVHVQAGK